MKKWSIAILVILVLSIGAYAMYRYLYKPHRDIQAEAPSLVLPSEEAVLYFEKGNGEKILDRTVLISGTVTEIDGNTLTLDDAIHCSFDQAPAKAVLQQAVTVKGRCIGYDDLFELVKLDQCQLK